MLNTNYIILAEIITALGTPNPSLTKAMNDAPRIQVEQTSNSILDYYIKTKDSSKKEQSV